VNPLNRAEEAAGRPPRWEAEVVEENIPGRSAAKKAEQAATNELYGDGHSMSLHTLPKPEK
jgi:hypothetical protein